MAKQALALLKQLEAAAEVADDLAVATRAVFQQHPDAANLVRFPGLGKLPAARLLAEIGDDTHRFADVRGLKAHAGADRVTRASGKKLIVLHALARMIGWPRSATCGASRPCVYHPTLELTTIGALFSATGMEPLNATSSIASSVVCASACTNRQLYSEELAFPISESHCRLTHQFAGMSRHTPTRRSPRACTATAMKK
jgi:hypothetical protein